jgi:hypothetical protein
MILRFTEDLEKGVVLGLADADFEKPIYGASRLMTARRCVRSVKNHRLTGR